MSANRQMYGWAALGNSDAHTLTAIGRGCTWFEGKTASHVRATIEAGLTAPGGKLWRVHDYVRLARYRIGKRGPQSLARRPRVA